MRYSPEIWASMKSDFCEWQNSGEMSPFIACKTGDGGQVHVSIEMCVCLRYVGFKESDYLRTCTHEIETLMQGFIHHVDYVILQVYILRRTISWKRSKYLKLGCSETAPRLWSVPLAEGYGLSLNREVVDKNVPCMHPFLQISVSCLLQMLQESEFTLDTGRNLLVCASQLLRLVSAEIASFSTQDKT